MATFSAAAINKTVRQIRSQTGARVEYRNGAWYVFYAASSVPRYAPVRFQRQWTYLLEDNELEESSRTPLSGAASFLRGAGGAGARGIGSGAASLAGAVGGAASFAASAGIGIASTLVVTAFGLIVTAVTGMVAVIKTATNEASNWARSLSSLRSNTGLSFTQGFGVASRGALFGISPQDTASQNTRNPLFSRMRGFGLDYSDPNYMSQLAGRYQGMANNGPFGRLLANRMLDQQYGGSAPDSVRNIASNYSQSQIKSQLAFGQSFQSSIGLNPALLKEYATTIPLITQRIGFMASNLYILLAVKLAPLIEKTFGGIATLIAKNSDKIVAGIGKAVNWLTFTFPPMFLHFVGATLNGAGALLLGISKLAEGFVTHLPAILMGIQTFLNGLLKFGGVLAGMAAVAIQAASNLLNPQGSPNPTGNAVQSAGGWLNNQAGIPQNPITNTITAAYAAKGAWGAAKWLATRFGPAVAAGAGAAGAGGAGGLTGLLTNPWVAIPAMGIAAGAAGYETLRHFNVGGARSWGSTAQILGLAPTAAQMVAANQQAATNPLGAFGASSDPSWTAAFARGQSAFMGQVGQFNFANDPALQSNLSNWGKLVQGKAKSGADSLFGAAGDVNKLADNWPAEMNKTMKEVEKNTKETAENTQKSTMDMLGELRRLIGAVQARASVELAEDFSFGLLSSGGS